MKNPLATGLELFARITAIGIVGILIAAAIEFVLTVIAIAIGIVVWITHDWFTGFVWGVMSFFIGQLVVIVLIEALDLLPEKPKKEPSDDGQF